MSIPLFPLSNVVLFPHAVLPLYIFEARYKQMVEDLLLKPEDERLLVIAAVMDAKENFYHIGTVGKIIHFEKLDDGCFNILVLGLFKVHPTEIRSNRLYRQAHVDVIEDELCSADEDVLKNNILHALRIHRSNVLVNFPEFLTRSIHEILPLLCYGLPFSRAQKLALLSESSVKRRVELIVKYIKSVPQLIKFIVSESSADTLVLN